MDNAVWTPTEAGTQAQGMDLVQARKSGRRLG